ncbi:MAG: OB-fold nucleic acid binding domain-containing protein, partial [Fusobacterium polymorphum]
MIESYRNIYSKLEDIPTKYITAKQLSNLKSLGINTVYDLIYYFPRAYDDRTNIKKIGELKFNEYVVLKANVMSVVNLTVRSGKKIVKAMVTDGTGIMEILWFGMPYIKKSLKIGEEYLFIGQTKKAAVFQLINPEYKLFSGQQKLELAQQLKEICAMYNVLYIINDD